MWQLSEREINRFLHALLGDLRLRLRDKGFTLG